MRRKGYNLGGEQSGHLIFLDHASTGDGIVAALQILAIMVREQKPLSELAHGVMERVPQVLVSFPVSQKKPLAQLPSFQEELRQVETELGSDGRVLVRFSGTENKARVLVEGPDAERIQTMAEELQIALTVALENV